MINNACQQPSVDIVDPIATAQKTEAVKTEGYVDLTVKGDYEVRNGMVYFKNAKAFFELDNTLRKLSHVKRIEFTKNLGFTSLFDALNTAQNAISDADTREKYTELLQKNSDILQLQGDVLNPVYADLSAAILNREGMVSIGGQIHCFGKTRTVIAPDMEKVRASFKAGKKTDESVILVSLAGGKNTGARTTTTTCATYDKTADNSDGNRRVRVQAYVSRQDVNTGFNLNTVNYYVYVYGTPYKKNLFGSWVNYSTGNLLVSKFDISMTIIEDLGANGYYYHTTYYTINNTSDVDGTGNSYSQLLTSYNNVSTFDLTQTNFYTFTNYFSEASPLGYYASGGVPTGVTMQCQ